VSVIILKHKNFGSLNSFCFLLYSQDLFLVELSDNALLHSFGVSNCPIFFYEIKFFIIKILYCYNVTELNLKTSY